MFLIFADAWIARLAPDQKALGEEPRPMLAAKPGPQGIGRLTLGDPGVNVFKHKGRYYVLAARWQVCDGNPSHDAVLWKADSVYGPYHDTGRVLVGVGPVSVFWTSGGTWRAVSSRRCAKAPHIVEVPLPR